MKQVGLEGAADDSRHERGGKLSEDATRQRFRGTVAGAQLLELIPVSPLTANMPLGVAVLSYAGQLTLTTVVDPKACPVAAIDGGDR